MEDPKAAAERLHTALSEKKNREETCLDVVINNDLEHRLLISDSLLEASKSEYNLRISIR